VDPTEELTAEGGPEPEFVAGIAARMPRKRCAAGALVQDGEGRFLMVEPAYKDTWELPGGVLEEGEAPAAGCRRELVEELGLELVLHRLLVVDWVPSSGPWHDAVLFVFDAGVLSSDRIAAIRWPPDELRGVRMVDRQRAAAHVRPSTLRRITVALDVARTGTGPAYLQFGRPVLTG
jgi:8-oxo-dGTP pyrophosphatase MutT (NUDIX family)